MSADAESIQLPQLPQGSGGNLPVSEESLQARFSDERIGAMAEEFLEVGTPYDLRKLAGDRQFVVAYIPADSPYSDIPRSVETTVFSRIFRLPLTQVIEDYGKYDPVSTFAAVIDVSTEPPRAAGALRICEYDPNLGFKDVNDLVSEENENPWLEEIKREYFAQGEEYDPTEAWKRLGERAAGSELILEESLDISSHAALEEYQGPEKTQEFSKVSMLFFHACLRYAHATGKKNLLAIFDLKPLDNLQQFGKPFELYPGLSQHPYGGDGDTLPAFCKVGKETQARVRAFNEYIGQVLIDGDFLDTFGLLPNEYQPELYSKEAVNL